MSSDGSFFDPDDDCDYKIVQRGGVWMTIKRENREETELHMENQQNYPQVIIDGLEGDTVTVLHGEAKRPDNHKWQGIAYRLSNTESLINLATRFLPNGDDHEFGVTFSDEQGFTIVLDRRVHDRNQDIARYDFELSDEVKDGYMFLQNETKEVFSTRTLVEWLRDRPMGGQLNPEFVKDMFEICATISSKTDIITTDNYKNENEGAFSVRVQAGTQTVMPPKEFVASLELIKDSGQMIPVSIKLDTILPKSAGDNIQFVMTCPNWKERYFMQAVRIERRKLEKGLPGFLHLNGTYNINNPIPRA